MHNLSLYDLEKYLLSWEDMNPSNFKKYNLCISKLPEQSVLESNFNRCNIYLILMYTKDEINFEIKNP